MDTPPGSVYPRQGRRGNSFDQAWRAGQYLVFAGESAYKQPMPGYRAHIFGGATVALAGGGLLYVLGLERNLYTLGGMGGACLAGALFPDIDTDSKAQRLFYIVLLILDGWLLYTRRIHAAAWLGVGAILPGLVPHRGLTHTVTSAIVLSAAISFLPYLIMGLDWHVLWPFGVSFGVGVLSHLLLDQW